MINLSQILSADAVEASLSVANKKALFQQLGTMAGRTSGISAKVIVSAISEREKIGSTGFGSGTAIPHGKIQGLERVTGYFARLSAPIDYLAVDRLPVDLVFLLLSPVDAGADHLKALATVSRAFRDPDTLAKLRGARSKDALFAVLAGEESRHAA